MSQGLIESLAACTQQQDVASSLHLALDSVEDGRAYDSNFLAHERDFETRLVGPFGVFNYLQLDPTASTLTDHDVNETVDLPSRNPGTIDLAIENQDFVSPATVQSINDGDRVNKDRRFVVQNESIASHRSDLTELDAAFLGHDESFGTVDVPHDEGRLVSGKKKLSVNSVQHWTLETIAHDHSTSWSIISTPNAFPNQSRARLHR